MVNQEIAKLASQAAATHMTEVFDSIREQDDGANGLTVYASVFHDLKQACGITDEILEQRVTAWVTVNYPDKEAKGIVGNILKESGNPNMGLKIFRKLIKATFPA